MEEVYAVDIGEYKIAYAPAVLVSTGLGSCVAICLYDRTKRIGAMAHAMLPKMPKDGKDIDRRITKFVDQVVPMMIEELKKLEVDPKNLVAKLAGGANMFKSVGAYAMEMGQNNVIIAKELLGRYGVEIVSESTGGTSGRSVEFNISNGIVSVISKI